MILRRAAAADLDALAALEAVCFPPEEAASRERLEGRLRAYAGHFRLLCGDDGAILSYAAGPVTRQADLTDDLYADPTAHSPEGRWQMLFGVGTRPDCRGRGYASRCVEALLETARAEGRAGAVLTCKEALLPFYGRLGFADEGVSPYSTHGGAVWHQMRLRFPW